MDVTSATLSVAPLLKASAKTPTDVFIPPNWRVNQKNFLPENFRQICQPGTINFSAGWFGQGHEASKKNYLLKHDNFDVLLV